MLVMFLKLNQLEKSQWKQSEILSFVFMVEGTFPEYT